jgi:autotransporter-associated beta strand protein
MGKYLLRAATVCIAAISWLNNNCAHAQLRAFGSAEGFGAVATGGRNASSPTIYHVTNLNDAGTGSFRDAVSGSNRIIVFDVSGYVHLASAVSAKSNLTILGQTAPGDGIGIYGAEVSFFGQSNDIVRYLRFLDTTLDPGYKGSSSTSSSSSNCINIGSSSNMIFDHVSAEFAPYNNIDAATAPNLTFQNSLIAAPLASQRFNFHWEGGGSAGNWGAGTFVNNVFVDGHNRSILSKGDTQYINNTVYNYQAGYTSGNSGGNFRYDVINNYFITGPSTTSAGDDFYQVDSTQSAYATGNLLDSNKDGTLNGSSDNSVDGATVLTSPWSSSTSQLPQLSAASSYAWNVAHAGDSLKHDPTTYAASVGYDQVDSQMMTNVQTLGTGGRLWTSESQTGLANGGLGILNNDANNTGTVAKKPTDTDNDGIPDAWETAHGMNPNSASDALLLNPVGYRMIEQYANELGSTNDSRTWTAASGTWTTSANWTGSVVPGALDYALIRGNGSANGAVTISSGTASAMTASIGGNGPATGEKIIVSGGTLNVYDTMTIGDQNNGSLQINSGTVQAYNIILGNTVYNPIATNYTGTINLNGGTLALSQLVLGAGTPSHWTTGGSLVWSGGTLQAIAQLNVNVPISVSNTGGTINSNSFSGTLSGVISGNGGITKTGLGTITLTGSNTYIGPTTVNQGTLLLGSSNRIANASNLVLGGGTFATGGFGETLAALGLSASSTIDLGAGSSMLQLSDSHALHWTGTLTVANWSGSVSGGGTDRIFFGASFGGLSLAQLNSIVFSGSGSPHAVQLSTGEVVPGTPAPPPILGDFNRDGIVTSADIVTMLSALVNLPAYEANQNFTDVDLLATADLNGDGKVTNTDLQALLNKLRNVGSSTSAVPEPNGFLLAAITSAFALLALRRGFASRLCESENPAACLPSYVTTDRPNSAANYRKRNRSCCRSAIGFDRPRAA